MRFNERREANRADRKARLLAALKECEATGQPVKLTELEIGLRCPKSTLHRIWLELAEEKQVAGPYTMPRRCGPNGHVPEAELAARVEAVRRAKIEVRIRERRSALSEAELEELLP